MGQADMTGGHPPSNRRDRVRSGCGPSVAVQGCPSRAGTRGRVVRRDGWGGRRGDSRRVVGAIPLVVASLAVAPFFLDESVATAGMGFLFYLYAIPVLSLVFVAWAVASRRLPDGPRRLAMVATIVLACGAWTWCGVTV